MILCLCRGVSEHQVRSLVAAGAATVDSVQAVCGAGGDCGACTLALIDLIEATGSGLASGART